MNIKVQHYSALLRDEVAGKHVNLINADKPSDIYMQVAEVLKRKLENDRNNNRLADCWLNLGINRKLTKRPVMVLPYGGTRLSCREYVEVYLKDNYSGNYIWECFQIGNNPSDCSYKASLYLSNFLWEAIQETLKSAVVGMDYIKSLARTVMKYHTELEWYTPMHLLIHQAYPKVKNHKIATELYGSTIYTIPEKEVDKQKQLNGICPNFIHSLDASCLMKWLLKCNEAGLNQFMSVHDCYGVLAPDTELSARLLREAFVEVYTEPVLDNLEADLIENTPDDIELPEKPEAGKLDINSVLTSNYFFN